jgi:ABC-type nickel/cobalt efflux system permease component RcnA
MIALLSGLIAGAVHVWSGPDHLAAVAPLALKQRRRPWLSGLRWGLGHSAGVAVVGLLSLGLRDVLPLESLSEWSERLVGALLIGIGLWALHAAFRRGIHAHEHEHDGERHVHIHVHDSALAHEDAVAHRGHLHAAFGIGALHGVAGSSHFLGVLPMLAFPTQTGALTYLGAYAAGTIVSMALFAWALGVMGGRWGGHSSVFYRGLMVTSAVAAFAIGCVWMFSAAP